MITIEPLPDASACIARISGDIDIGTVPGIRDAVDAAITGGCMSVVMDLGSVGYADSSALSMMLWLDKRLHPCGGKLILANADHNVARILELSGLITVAPSVSAARSVDEAVGALELAPSQLPAQWTKHLDAPAAVDRLSEIRSRVVEWASPLGLSDSALFDLKVAVGEALANAVRHGSPGGPEDVVTVDVSAFEDRVEVLVSDCGRGFDGATTCADDVFAVGGRGVMFMRALMDRVEFRSCTGGGTSVRLIKRLPLVPGAAGEG
jgi:serine/threonine-protein kinase RsbW